MGNALISHTTLDLPVYGLRHLSVWIWHKIFLNNS